MLLQVDPKLFDLVVKELVDQLLLLLHTLHELVPAGVLPGRGGVASTVCWSPCWRLSDPAGSGHTAERVNIVLTSLHDINSSSEK